MERKIDEAAVWKRVTAAGTGAEPAKEPAFAQAVLAALVTGRSLAWAYESLARGGKRFCAEFAQSQRSENRLLKSIYYLHTGQNPRLPESRPNQDPTALYLSRLRHMLELQATQQEALKGLAETVSGSEASLLTELHRKAGLRWEGLLSELARQLEKT